MFVKDETLRPNPRKNIRVAYAGKAEGPYGPASAAISPDWVEGPTLLWIGDWCYLYYDAYTRHRYEGARSRNLTDWESITDKLTYPKGVHHGTAFEMPVEVVEKLLKQP